jgi:hypothetical protein
MSEDGDDNKWDIYLQGNIFWEGNNWCINKMNLGYVCEEYV